MLLSLLMDRFADQKCRTCMRPSLHGAWSLAVVPPNTEGKRTAATTSGSAARPAQTQQQSRTMFGLFNELKKLHDQSWIVDDAEVALKEMIEQARHLQIIPATRAVLRTPEIRALYTSICGAVDPMHSGEGQDYTHVSLAACYASQEKVSRFLQGREEIEEATSERYPFLWELKSRAHDAVLNGLPIMPAFRYAAFPNSYAHLPELC